MTSSFPEAERHAAVALALVPGIGPVRYGELMAKWGSAVAALAAHPRRAEVSTARTSATRVLQRCCRLGAAVLVRGEPPYPERLLQLPYPPPLLFALGDLTLLDAPCVTIVGTRTATAYGERVTRAIASALAGAGVTVVSGMARGIDGAAHRGALDAGGGTIAVLGTGVDVAYPATHRLLHRRITERGLVVSEELPGTSVAPGVFPKRNRLMAALGSLVIVVEAGQHSGALLTATDALDLGRTVAAVPGPIDAPQSVGANELLRDGACVIASVADAFVLAGLAQPIVRAPTFGSAAEQAVWDALAGGRLDVDTLSVRAGLSPRACMAAVAALELTGVVACAPTGEVHRVEQG